MARRRFDLGPGEPDVAEHPVVQFCELPHVAPDPDFSCQKDAEPNGPVK